MSPHSPQLTIDDAIAQFQAVLKEELGDSPPHIAMAPETPEEAEARLFRFAEFMLGLACPDPAACPDQRCRRNARCRHVAHVRATNSRAVRAAIQGARPAPRRPDMRSGCTCHRDDNERCAAQGEIVLDASERASIREHESRSDLA
jgi:hypothetical protein